MPGPGTSKKFPHGKSVKNPDTYEALKKKGMSKSSAAAISNAQLNTTGKRGKHRKKS
jgi:hypothetical protein